MMSGHYSFTSCFAPFIESMITEKRNAGFQYEHAEWILHKFDEFCNQEQVETPVITQELAGKWGTLRKTETKVTLAGRISVLRQLSLYMQAYGIKCYVPRNFTRKSNRSAYVLSIEEIQSLFLEIDSYQPTINAEVFHRLAGIQDPVSHTFLLWTQGIRSQKTATGHGRPRKWCTKNLSVKRQQ